MTYSQNAYTFKWQTHIEMCVFVSEWAMHIAFIHLFFTPVSWFLTKPIFMIIFAIHCGYVICILTESSVEQSINFVCLPFRFGRPFRKIGDHLFFRFFFSEWHWFWCIVFHICKFQIEYLLLSIYLSIKIFSWMNLKMHEEKKNESFSWLLWNGIEMKEFYFWANCVQKINRHAS